MYQGVSRFTAEKEHCSKEREMSFIRRTAAS